MSQPPQNRRQPDLAKGEIERVIERYKRKLAAAGGDCATILVDAWDLTILVALAEKGAHQARRDDPGRHENFEEPARSR